MLTAIVCVSAAVFSAAAESGCIRGDADGDGKVSISNVTRAAVAFFNYKKYCRRNESEQNQKNKNNQ